MIGHRSEPDIISITLTANLHENADSPHKISTVREIRVNTGSQGSTFLVLATLSAIPNLLVWVYILATSKFI